MQKKALWILVTIVVTLVISSLLWNFSMQATGAAGRLKTQVDTTDGKPNFDIRDPDSKEAVSKFESRLQKISSKLREKNNQQKNAMRAARERWARGSSGMRVSYSKLTNTPEIIEMNGGGAQIPDAVFRSAT